MFAGFPPQSGVASTRRTSRLWSWFLSGFVIFWLITTSGAIFPVLLKGQSLVFSDGDRALLRLMLLPSLAIVPVLVFLRFRAMVSLLLLNPIVILLLLWVSLSILWSFDTGLTARRTLSFAANTLIACYLVVDRDLDWILKVFAWCMLTLLLVSVVFILLLPAFGAMPDGRGLRGAFTHKNSLGELSVCSLIIFFAALKRRVVPRYVGISGFLIALLLLIPTNAASSVVVGLVVLVIQAYLLADGMPFKQRATLLVLAVAIGIPIVMGALLNIESILTALGRDATLTGRTEIWPYVLHMVEQRPLVGYGYEAFWEVNTFARYVQDAFEWSIPTAHNGYLDILLGLGWLGLALAIAFVVTMAFRLVAGGGRLDHGIIAFAMLTLAYYLVFNLVESKMLTSSGLSWILVVIAALLLTPGLARIKDPGIVDRR